MQGELTGLDALFLQLSSISRLASSALRDSDHPTGDVTLKTSREDVQVENKSISQGRVAWYIPAPQLIGGGGSSSGFW